jgi:hypothetical protein
MWIWILGFQWLGLECLLGLEDLSLEGFGEQMTLEYFLVFFASKVEKINKKSLSQSNFTLHPRRKSHFYRFLYPYFFLMHIPAKSDRNPFPFVSPKGSIQCSPSSFFFFT